MTGEQMLEYLCICMTNEHGNDDDDKEDEEDAEEEYEQNSIIHGDREGGAELKRIEIHYTRSYHVYDEDENNDDEDDDDEDDDGDDDEDSDEDDAPYC
jgi:hypothetical protein